MKNWLDKYSDNVPQAQNGENIDRYNIDVRRTNMIDYVPYYENVPDTEFDKESVERAKREAERYNADVERRYGPQNEYRTPKSAEKAAERLKQLKQNVEITPITKNKEKQEEKQEEKLETDNKKYNNTTSSKTTNKKQKKKKEKDDEDEGGSGYFPPPFIIDAPNYTGVKPEFYNNVNDESKDDAGVVNTDVFAPSEISYKDYVNINSANYRNAQKLAGNNLGLQLLLNNEKYNKDVDILQKEVEENEYSKILAQEKNKNAVNLGRAVNNIPQAQNGIEGTMAGLTDRGFNSNGAWGGQFQEGGDVPKVQSGKNVSKKKPIVVSDENDPRYKAYQDSLSLYEGTKSINDFIKKNNIGTFKKNSGKPLSEKEKNFLKINKTTYNKNNVPKDILEKYDSNVVNSNIKPISFEKYIATIPKEISFFGNPSDDLLYETTVLGHYKKPIQPVEVKKINPGDSKATQPVILEERVKQTPIKNSLQSADIVNPNMNIEADNKITPLARKPKKYKVETSGGGKFGGWSRKEEVVDPNNISANDGNKRTVTPIYQSGGEIDYKTVKDNFSNSSRERRGEGYNTKGRNYSPAWGGQFQDGGNVSDEDYNMKRALELGYTADESGHWPSVDNETGEWLKSKKHHTRGMEMMAYELNPELRNKYNLIENEKGKLQYVPKLQKIEEYQMGGNVYPVNYVPQAQDGISEDAMRGMMKSKIGMGNAFNHPAIKRMSQAMPKTGMTPEGIGTHYMSSVDNYAVPLLQDLGEEELTLVDPDSRSREAIRFNSPEEAQYFAENYKDVAPMSNTYKGLQEYAMGGSIPGSVGFTYARTKGIPSEGPYAKKTLPSAQDGFSERNEGLTRRDNIKTFKPIQEKDRVLTKAEKEAIKQAELAEKRGDIKKYTPQSKFSKVKEAALNPLTAFGYVARNEDIPENFSRSEDTRNILDNAIDFVNPAFYVESAENLGENQVQVLSDLSQGNFGDAALSQTMAGVEALNFIPLAKGAKPLLNKGMQQLKNIPPSSIKTLPQAKNIREAIGTFAGIPTERSLPRLSPEELKIYRQAQEIGRMRSTGKPISEQYRYAIEQNLPEEHLQKIFKKSKSEIESAIPDAVQTEAFRTANPIRDRLNLQRPPRGSRQTNIDQRDNVIRNTLADFDIDDGIDDILERLSNNQLNPIPEELILNVGYNRGRTLLPGQKEGISLSDSFYAKNADLQRNIYNNLQSYKNKIITNTQDYPGYSGPVLENVPSLSLSSSGSLKGVSNKVTGQSTSGINSGDVFTGSLNTSHSSYLPQLKQVFKYGEGSPQFLGYKPMNQMGFLSDFNYSADDVAKYLNTEIDEQIKRGIIPKNVSRPYSTNKPNANYQSVNLPHYGIKQFQDGGVIKDDMGYWNPDNWGSPVEINSNNITMEGVYEPLLGVSDKGERRIMYPGEKHKFKKGTKKVTEFPIAKNGIRQEQKGLQNLDQLTNFTNYNKPTGWLSKYE
jgi:hypothetical protein